MTVSVLVPVGVFRLVEMVNVDVPEPVTDDGLKLAFERDGSPLTLKLTAPLNPPEPVTVMVVLVLEPCRTLSELGDAEIEKSGLAPTGFTVRETVTVWAMPLLAPVTVTL